MGAIRYDYERSWLRVVAEKQGERGGGGSTRRCYAVCILFLCLSGRGKSGSDGGSKSRSGITNPTVQRLQNSKNSRPLVTKHDTVQRGKLDLTVEEFINVGSKDPPGMYAF